jgi:hypothetical protein
MNPTPPVAKPSDGAIAACTVLSVVSGLIRLLQLATVVSLGHSDAAGSPGSTSLKCAVLHKTVQLEMVGVKRQLLGDSDARCGSIIHVAYAGPSRI